MKTKLLFLLLAALICMTAFTAAVFASETESTETTTPTIISTGTQYHPTNTETVQFTWELDSEGTLTFYKGSSSVLQTASQDTNIYRAVEYWRKETTEGYSVTNENLVKKIVVSDGFTYIRNQHNAPLVIFGSWPKLTTIIIPSSVYFVNNYTNEGFFSSNPELTTISHSGTSENNREGVVNLEKITRVDGGSGTYPNFERMFYNCPSITEVILPSKNTSSTSTNATYQMFYGCTSLKQVNFPAWMTSIGTGMFYNCSSLESLTLPATVSSIAASALTGCTGLKSITFGSPALTIPEGMVIPDNEGLVITCTSAAQYEAVSALVSNATVNLEIPPANLMADGTGYQYSYDNGVLTIAKADTTTSTTLNRDVALEFAGQIKTVIISEDTGITEIGANVFDGFAAETVVIPSTVTTISSAAFANMPNLKTVVDYTAYTADNTAGAGIINIMTATSVAADAFSGSCAALTPVVYMGKTVAISGDTFSWFADDATETICVYPSASATTFFRDNSIAFEYLTVDQTGDALLAREYSSWVFDTETGKLTWNLSGGNLSVGKNATAWPNWKAVWKNAIEYFFIENTANNANIYYQHNDSPFSNLPNLKHVHMGGIAYLRRSTYGTNGLFRNCPSLTTVSYGSDSEFDNVIDLTWWKKNDYMMNAMFYGCTSITNVILPTSLTKYDVESSSEIGIFSYMFYGCSSLTEIEIPDCFETFYDNAFKGCTSLTSIKLSTNPLYYDLTAFPDQEGLTIEVANSFVAGLFEDYNFTLTQVTYPEGEANSYFVEVAQPVTNIIGDFSTMRPVDSAAELEEICSSTTPPAAVLVDVDSALNVSGLDMTVSELLAALEYRIFAAFRVSDSATVTALNEYLTSIGFFDVYVIGTPALIAESYALNYSIHHIVDYSDVYTEALTSDDCVAIRREIYTNGAKMVILPYSACSRDIINNLYNLSVTVWMDMPENAGVAENYASVLSGAIGVVTEDTDEILDIACNVIAENTMSRYPRTSGHRGNETVTPENTLEGCLYAVNHGAQSVEIDIYITTDGEIVLMHDSTTTRTCNGTLTVESSTLAQLKELYVNKGFEDHELYSQCRIPTLNEIFEALKDYDVLINIEFKTTKTTAVDAVIALIEEYDMYGKCCFSSFRFDQFKRMHDNYPELPGIMLFRPILMQDYSADLNANYVIKTTGNYNANASLTNTNNVGGAASMSALIRRGVPVQSWSGTGLQNKVLSGMNEISDIRANFPNSLTVTGASETVLPGASETLTASYKDYYKNLTAVTDVTYTVIEGADLATIDAETGVITYGNTAGTVSFIASYKYSYADSAGTVSFDYYVPSGVYTVEIAEAESTVLSGAEYESDGVTARFTWAFDTETGILTFTKGSEKTLNSSDSRPAYNTWRAQYEELLDEKLTKIVLVGIQTIQYQHSHTAPLAGYASLTTIDLGGATRLQNGYAKSYGAFSANPKLTTIYANGGTAEGDAEGVVNLSKLSCNTAYSSSNPANAYMFSGDKAIKKVIMPSSALKCAYICPGMFKNCESLTEITIPAYVTTIYKDAFLNCNSLTYVNVLGGELTSVDATAFPDQEGLVIDVTSYNIAKLFDACGFTKTVVNYPFAGIVTMEGFNVRVAKYNGLRGLFTADMSKITEMAESNYTLLEFGGLVSAATNRANAALADDGSGAYKAGSGVVKAEVWNSTDGTVGKYLSTTTEDKLDFAVTIINFKEANYISDVYFCAYEIWKNPNGEIEIYYKDYDGTDYDEVSIGQICNAMWSDGTITEEMDAEGIVKGIVDFYEDYKPRNILFIGNSFTYYNDMPTAIFPVIAEAANREVTVTAITNGGHTLAEFATSTDTYGAKVVDAFANNSFDYVIIQEQSHRPISNPESFYSAVRTLKEMARQNGAKTYLYATWGYDADHTSLSTYGNDTADMEMKLRAAYQYIGEELDIPVCHVGAAMTHAFTNSSVSLYKSDNYHPLTSASTLAALTIFSTIYGVDPASIDVTVDGVTADEMTAMKASASYVYNGDMSVPEEYKTASTKPLDGKRIIFIGNSHIYYGTTVLYKDPASVLTQEARMNDQGLFYQLCKANGMNVNVTNWTFSNHVFSNLFGGACSGTSNGYGCAGVDHSSYLVDPYYDYVVACYGTFNNPGYTTAMDNIIEFFTDANPNVKICLMAQATAHGVSVSNPEKDTTFLETLKDYAAKGVTIIDWGKLIADIINGDVTVPGATLDYVKNTFVVDQSATDGFHPNLLTGYLTTLMTYSALTGESAVGQPYYFVGDDSYCSDSYYRTFDEYKAKYYTYNSATTNFDQVFASEADMTGLQTLVDQYLEEKAYEDYDFKKIIFIGDSFIYWGNTVLDKGYSSESKIGNSLRRYDTGLFYQLCKANGMDVNVVNWTFGSHGIGSIMNENGCGVSSNCPCNEGKSHMSYLTDTDFDYVVISGGRNSASSYESYVNYLTYYKDYFSATNPDVKMYYLVSSGAHNISVSETFPIEILNNLDEFEKMGYTVIDWGKIVADIINGDVTVPGGTLEYNKNSFVVSRSSSDGYHPNQLAGYITTLMTYCAIFGESAVGQPYSFVGDTSLSPESNYYSFEDYVATYYTYNGATTNYPDVFASEADMTGLQTLIDKYLEEKAYRDYNFQ